MDPQLYGQLIFDKVGKNIQWKKVSSTSVFGKTGQQHVKNETGPLSYIIHRNKCKRIKDLNVKKKDLNVKQETIKMLEESTDSNLFDLGHRNFLLDTLPEARKTKVKFIRTSSRLPHSEENNQQN